MEIEYLNSILYLQYNTIAEEAHSHPVCEGFLLLLHLFATNWANRLRLQKSKIAAVPMQFLWSHYIWWLVD